MIDSCHSVVEKAANRESVLQSGSSCGGKKVVLHLEHRGNEGNSAPWKRHGESWL